MNRQHKKLQKLESFVMCGINGGLCKEIIIIKTGSIVDCTRYYNANMQANPL